MIWHSSSVDEIVKKLGTSKETGLFNEQISTSTKKYGKNTLSKKKNQSFFIKFLYQFKNVTTVILLIAALLSLVVSISTKGTGLDFALIIVIVLVNGLIGAFQEIRVENALETLSDKAATHARVIRNSEEISISSLDVIPGDIILLSEGDRIPADGRIIECEDLRCDENVVTGEPVTVDKDAKAVLNDMTPLTERSNMVYSGCTVTAGTAKAVVVATGVHTEMGKIKVIEYDRETLVTPLQNKIKQTGKMLAYIVAAICILLFAIGMIFVSGDIFEKFTQMFMTSIAVAASAIPEGLFALITFVSVFGINRMISKKALISSPSVMENLGKVSVICTDKTGTLTQNKMTAVKFFDGTEIIPISEETLTKKHKNAIMMAAMCCDGDVSVVDGQEVQIGDHTEAGIVLAAMKYAGADKETLDSLYPRVAEIPFTAERKIKTTVNMIDGKPVAIVKGSPDILVNKCNNADLEKINDAMEKMAASAMRVIGIAFKALGDQPTEPTPEELECDLIFAGLIGLADPPRDEVSLALDRCRSAGIRVIMITGDQLSTAVSSARNMGILTTDSQTLTGEELSALTDEEFLSRVDEITVYSRVTSEQKIRIIDAWRSKGEMVLMTGDSVNDAPVLKSADIGCAMGNNGADVAIDAADVTVMDENFSTIVKCVEMGRNIYNNILKGVQYLLGCKLGIIITFLLAMLIWQTSPIFAVQLIWISFVIDMLPAFALGSGAPTKDMMKTSVKKDEKFFSKDFLTIVCAQGLLYTVVTLIAFGIGNGIRENMGQTMGFAVLSLSHIFGSFALSTRLPLWDFRRYKANLLLLISIIITATVTVLALCLSPLQTVFNTMDLGGNWATVIILSIIPAVVIEATKIAYFIIGKKRNLK